MTKNEAVDKAIAELDYAVKHITGSNDLAITEICEAKKLLKFIKDKED